MKLGQPAGCPFSPLFGGEGSPTKIDYRKKIGYPIVTSLLEDLERETFGQSSPVRKPHFANGHLSLSNLKRIDLT